MTQIEEDLIVTFPAGKRDFRIQLLEAKSQQAPASVVQLLYITARPTHWTVGLQH